MRADLLPATLLVVVLLGPVGAPAQDGPADTTASTGALETGPRPPVRTAYVSPVDTLGELPGAFVYELGEADWPDGWSRFGLPPRAAELTFEELPFRDPLTGRPLFELLPFELMRPLRTTEGAPGAAARLRSFSTVLPRTELRYRAGSGTRQFISAGHVQQGSPGVGGRTDSLQMLFGFRGASTNGIYPNADSRLRQVLGRVRYERPGWEVALTELYTSDRRGAHGGVVPRGGRASLFVPLGARVQFPSARYRSERNDLSGRLRLRWAEGRSPAVVRSRWTRAKRTYRRGTDTLRTETGQLALRAAQRLGGSAHRLRLEAGWAATRHRVRAAGRTYDRYGRGFVEAAQFSRWTGWILRARGRVQRERGFTFGTGSLTLRRGGADRFGALTLAYGEEPPPWGAGGALAPFLTGSPRFELVRRLRVRPVASVRAGHWELGLEGAYQRSQDALLLRVGSAPDRAGFVQGDSPVAWSEVAGRITWRTRTARGLRVRIRPTYRMLVEAPDDHRDALSRSLPVLSVSGEVGLRYRLFQDDLDLHLGARGTAWSRLRGRTFHGPTGLFPLPAAEAPGWGPSGRLDLTVEAGVRDEATLFFAYENALGGVGSPGALLVQGHPVPARTFRFGVYWPLLD